MSQKSISRFVDPSWGTWFPFLGRSGFVLTLFFLASAALFAAPSVRFSPSSGTLTVGGSDGNDVLILDQSNSGVLVTIEIQGRSQSQMMPIGAIKKVNFSGAGGDDLFRNDSSIPSSVNGGAGDDTLRGGSGIDVIRGGDG
ncbi:hypothetical protein OAG77_01455, partial [bacterium]|nr:hypothetical protein [bacterium]